MTQAELTWVPGSAPRWFTRHKTVAHPGTNRAQRRVTTIDRDQHSTIKPNKLQQLAANNTSCISITIELHQQQVTYKLALLTHKVWTTATPTYLSELVQTHTPPRALHSSDALLLARCIFSVAAPSTWNSLPADIRLCESMLTIKRHLKTHLFKLT